MVSGLGLGEACDLLEVVQKVGFYMIFEILGFGAFPGMTSENRELGLSKDILGDPFDHTIPKKADWFKEGIFLVKVDPPHFLVFRNGY